MFFLHQGRRRALGGGGALFALVAVASMAALPALSWRTLLRDDIAVSLTWDCPGASAEQGERDILIPLERMLSTVGAHQMSATAVPERVTLSALIPSDVDEARIGARLQIAGRCPVASAPPPAVTFVRATSGIATDVMRVMLVLALALVSPVAPRLGRAIAYCAVRQGPPFTISPMRCARTR